MNVIKLSIFLFFFSACAKPSQHKAEQIFRFNQQAPLTSLDPAFASSQANIWAVNAIYNSLVQLDDSLNIKPCLAKSWNISDDGKVYTFHLRCDVKFHEDTCFNGQAAPYVKAKDVVYSFSRLLDKTVGAKGSWVFEGRVDSIAPFTAPNDSTFVLTLNQAFRPMLGILSMQYCSIVSQAAVDYYKQDFRTHPVGTGPFVLRLWKENQTLILRRNPHYFEHDEAGNALPYLDGARCSFMRERQTAFFEFTKGKLSFLTGLESSYINDVLSSEGELLPNKANAMDFYSNPYLNTEYFGILQQGNSPLANKKVRQALNYGLDRATMLKTLRNNIGVPAEQGFIPKGLPSFTETVKGYTYQPERAAQLLQEAGYPQGKGMAAFTLHTNAEYADLCTFAVKQWNDLGIPVRLEILDGSTLRTLRDKGELVFFRGSWIADYPDAENYFSLFYGKNTTPPNFTRFKNKDFDALYEAALKENDEPKRLALYQVMDRLLIEESPVVFLFYDEIAVFTQKNVSGLSRNALNLLNLKRVKIKK